MEKILVLTDLHQVEKGETIIGLDPYVRLRAALEQALAQQPDATRLILTGDLTHHGRQAQYARLRGALADVSIPITFLLGNHDNRAAFCAAFPEAQRDGQGFVQCVIDTASHRLICLDTLHAETEPYHAGYLCAARIAFLREALESAGSRHVVVFQHHPPFATGFDGMDAIALANGAEQLDLLAHHKIAHLVFGHIHRTISGSRQAVSFSTFKSPCHQMPMILGEGSSSSSVDEPGAYGVLLLASDGVIVHSEDVGLATALHHDGAS